MANVDWVGDEAVLAAMDQFARTCEDAINTLADYFARVMEASAKENAPWEDQTGNARQALYGFTTELAGKVVMIYLSHGMEYGRFLELRSEAKYAIIWPTIEATLPDIQRSLDELFS